jgi:hypothetical protein
VRRGVARHPDEQDLAVDLVTHGTEFSAVRAWAIRSVARKGSPRLSIRRG